MPHALRLLPAQRIRSDSEIPRDSENSRADLEHDRGAPRIELALEPVSARRVPFAVSSFVAAHEAMNPRPSHEDRAHEFVHHERFLRALARKLVHDQDLADDVVQDTWLAALQHPPRARETVRAWLARVTYNRAIQSFRARERRERRELHTARSEALPSPTDDLEREQARRLVVEALAATGEPYRTVILLRYYEGLEPREIAALLACPVETVRTRLKRGLERLRQRLDRRASGDRVWAGALMSLMPEEESSPSHEPERIARDRLREAAWIRSGRVARDA